MIRLFLLLCTLALSCVFLIVKPSVPMALFPFSDMKLSIQNYVYYACEHLILIVFALFIFMESDRFKFPLAAFLIIQIVDLLDFILTYSEPWFEVNGWPITFNVLKVAIFMLIIIIHGFSRELTSRRDTNT